MWRASTCVAAAGGRGGGTLHGSKQPPSLPVQRPQQARIRVARLQLQPQWRRQQLAARPQRRAPPKPGPAAPAKPSPDSSRPPAEQPAGQQPAAAEQQQQQRQQRQLECRLRAFALVLVSGFLLETACELSATAVQPAWLPPVLGAAIGCGFTALNYVGARRLWRGPEQPLRVVVTGSTRGIGKALARELLRKGDRVMVTSSSPANVRQAMRELRQEVGPQATLHGMACDVASPGAVSRLADAAASQMGGVDVWVNNAGCSGRYQGLLDSSPEQLQAVAQTNLAGALLGCQAALRVMSQQPGGGHIFNVDGAGADGLPTPNYAAYGATKAGIAQLMGSLNAEIAAQQLPVAVHTLSPGMVLTPLLLEGATPRSKAVFNVLCEQPETAAAFLAPRLRAVAARGGSRKGAYIRFLTLPSALWRFATSPLAANRFFGKQGEALYEEEKERLAAGSRAARRLALRAARQDGSLALAYSLSLAAAFALLVAESHGLLMAFVRLPLP